MASNYDFDGVIEFDVNQWLIDNYPRLTLTQRRAVCKQCIDNIDMDEVMEDSVTGWVSSLAMIAAGYITMEDLEEDEEDEEDD